MTVEEARAKALVRRVLREERIALLKRTTREKQAIRAQAQKREATRRLYSVDHLVLPRVFMRGPRWRQYFGVESVPIAEINPVAAQYHRPGRKSLTYTLEEDVRELVLEEIRPGVVAMWTDPRDMRIGR